MSDESYVSHNVAYIRWIPVTLIQDDEIQTKTYFSSKLILTLKRVKVNNIHIRKSS